MTGPSGPATAVDRAPGSPPPEPVTTTVAMASLGANRDQVVRLVEAGLLPELGRRGRTRLLDPTALTELAARPLLPDAGGDPAAPTYALVLHLGPRRPEPRPELYYRDVHGFHADGQTPDNAWTGWWNTGEQIAQNAWRTRCRCCPRSAASSSMSD